ncbi:hypothetical protein B9Y13_06650 [Acinetobacter baumannii]|nr:hypothetical protein B9Y13_06650 [Acinetobacter baumannii]
MSNCNLTLTVQQFKLFIKIKNYNLQNYIKNHQNYLNSLFILDSIKILWSVFTTTYPEHIIHKWHRCA